MKEKIYTIPLMDAFRADDECPFVLLNEIWSSMPLTLFWVPELLIWKMTSVLKQTKQDFVEIIIRKCLTMEIALEQA